MDHTGIPTEVAQAGNERWLGVFLRFDRLLSDPRTDGNSQQVFFRRDEAFQIVLRQAPEGPAGGAPLVPLVQDELLVCDVRRTAGQTQIQVGDIDTARRQAFVFADAQTISVQARTRGGQHHQQRRKRRPSNTRVASHMGAIYVPITAEQASPPTRQLQPETAYKSHMFSKRLTSPCTVEEPGFGLYLERNPKAA